MNVNVFFLMILVCVIKGQVLVLYLKVDNTRNIACGFSQTDYKSFYKNLKQATTHSIQYTCNRIDGLNPNSAVITSLNISQSSDYQCLYTCRYTYSTITCTRQRMDNKIQLSQANLVPIVSLNNSNTWDTCVPTIWSEFTYPYVWNHPSILLNKSCAPLCDGDNYANQTKTTQITEGHITSSAQTLSTSLSSQQSTNTISEMPSTSQGYGQEDYTETTIIIGACVGGGLFLILCLVIIIVLICIKRNRRPHRKHYFSFSDKEIDNSSKPKEQLVEINDKKEQEHPIVISHIGNYINGIQIVNNKVEIPVNDYKLPEYNTSTNRYSINNTSNIRNSRISEKDAHLQQTNGSSNVDCKQILNENNSDNEDFGYATTEEVSTKNDVYSKLGKDAREFQNPYNAMPDDATDGSNSKSKPLNTDSNIASRDPGQTGQQQDRSSRDNIPRTANIQKVDDSHVFHPSSDDIYAQVDKIKL